MEADQQRLTPTERVNLVAYLDRELPEGEARVIAAKLTRSVTARREVEALERTWDLLDHLPRFEPSRDLTERTVSLVRKFEAEGGRFESVLVRAYHRAIRAAGWTAVISIGFGAGFGATRWVWPNPTARLADNLSIAEHLDEYRDVGDFTFLKLLADSSEFGRDPDQ